MYFKKHITKDKIIIAICDEELLGKKFSEGDYTLNISKRFYDGEKKSEEELKDILKNFENINLVGKKIIKFATDMGILNKGSILKIDGIPHAQIIQI